MFDRYDTIYEAVGKERLERALRKAAQQRVWEQEPQPAAWRQVVARIGNVLIIIGTRLQADEQRQHMRQQIT